MSNISLRLSSSLPEIASSPINKKITYHSIQMNLQEIQRLSLEVDQNVKKVREEIEVTASLLAKLFMYEQDQE